MGSANFRSISAGLTAEQAFFRSCDEARHEYGQEYTGTIAEKDGFVFVELPLRIKAERVVEALDLAQFTASDCLTDLQEAAKSMAFLAKHFDNADNLLACYVSTWAPALCFQLRPPEIVKWGRYNTVAQGESVFLFAGHASQ